MDYGGFLLGLIAVAAFRRDRRMFVPACALWLNLRVLGAYYDATGEQFDWVVNSVVDYVAAIVVVLGSGGGRAAALVVAGFALSLAWHFNYGLVSDGGRAAQYVYWYQMSRTAWAQSFLVLAGGLDRGGGRRVRSLAVPALRELGRLPRRGAAAGVGLCRALLGRR